MNLIRTSLLTGTSTVIKVAAGFVTNKVVAVIAGPPGMALIGQVQNVSSILQNISSGIFGTAVVKYTAEWRDDPVRREAFLRLSFTIAFWASLAVGGFTAGISYVLARWLLKAPEYWWVFALLGALLPVFSINSLVLSVINGLGDVRRLTVINIAQSIVGLGVSVALPWCFGLAGALASAVLAATVIFVILLPELRRHAWLRLGRLAWEGDRENLRRLGNFALMAVVSGLCAPVAQIAVRGWIIQRCSADEAGYWQALMRLSSAYLMFFTTTLSVYFLPKFSSLDPSGVVRELKRGYALILPVLAGGFFLIWLARGWLVPMLFSPQFQPMKDLLAYQLTGDFLKIGSWIMSFVMLARAKTGLFIVSEIIFNTLYVGLSTALVGAGGEGGARGALVAWIVLYALYWAFVAAALPRMLSGGGPGSGVLVGDQPV